MVGAAAGEVLAPASQVLGPMARRRFRLQAGVLQVPPPAMRDGRRAGGGGGRGGRSQQAEVFASRVHLVCEGG
eukprot:11285034-Alexandrium_andersonii.AAC.1